MKDEAQRGLDWRSEFGRGGTEVGIARARDIVNDRNLPEATVVRMFSFFSRHEVNKDAEGFRPGEDGYPSNGRIAWALWGGDAGFAWSRRIVESLERSIDERPYPNEHAARIREPGKYDQFRRDNDAGGDGVDYIYGIWIEDDETRSEIQAIRFDKDRFTIGQAREWLDENGFDPIELEEATGERMEKRHIVSITETDDSFLIELAKGMDFEGVNLMPEQVEQVEEAEETQAMPEMETERLSKTETLTRAEHMEPEEMDDRRVRMAISSETPVSRSFGDEVLVHASDSVDLSFLNSGRAPLLADHDPERQIGVVESVELDSSARRLRATVRFSKNRMADEFYTDVVDGIRGNVSIGYRIDKMARDESDPTVYRAVSWRPMEVSIVSLPADPTVGVGRSIEATEPENQSVPFVEVVTMEQTNEQVRDDNVAAYKEVSEILEIAAKHNQRSLADECIRKGYNLQQFRGLLLDKLADKPLDTVDVELNQKEQRSYSLLRAVRGMATGKFDGFEREVSEELARLHGKEARGFYVPHSIFKRDILTSSPANGSNLVPTDHLADEFIDALRAQLVISGLGARMMTGLKGDVAIPALNAKTSVAFVAENNAPSEGAPTFRQVTMTPKTCVSYVDISRKLMMQSDPSVEQILRQDMTSQFASKIDDVAIEGGGANEPTGILGTNGIGSVAIGSNGGAITYPSCVNLEREVAIDNALAGNLSFLTNPKVIAAMRQTPRQTSGVEGNFILNDTNTLLGYNVASTTLVPSDLTKGTSSGVCSALIFGNFADLMIGMFGGLDILVDPYTGSSTGATRIAMYQDIDVAVRHAESFAAIKDITTV
jgi:HK97 family phage major capsid protein/HK97 family phage prohead protease